MAAVFVHSRFAGLQIEDDDSPSQGQKKKNKPSAAKKPDAVRKINPTKSNAKTQAAAQTKKKKSKAAPAPEEQWEQWKQKDEVLVDENFESELQQAILLSKLDLEQKKDTYKQQKKDVLLEKKAVEVVALKSGSKKQKKKNVMSLDQFNDMMSGEEPKVVENESNSPEDYEIKKDTEFFDRLKDETKNELLKDKINDRVRHRKPLSDEVINKAQFADTLEKKNKEITDLQEQITSLKKELLMVKMRNKKLCNILGQCEIKDKAEILVEVEKLRTSQTELTGTVAALHTELERERSRNADPRTKDKKKKYNSTGDKDK